MRLSAWLVAVESQGSGLESETSGRLWMPYAPCRADAKRRTPQPRAPAGASEVEATSAARESRPRPLRHGEVTALVSQPAKGRLQGATGWGSEYPCQYGHPPAVIATDLDRGFG